MTIRRNRPLRGGIVGFGQVAVEGHVPAWQTDRHFNMVAVCDPDEARLAVAASLLPDARRYATLTEMLDAERLDFVDIATPSATHTDLVLEVVARRVHVLCEKPLALTSDDCERIRSAASAARAVVFTSNNWKYAPLLRTVKRSLRRGEIGAVTQVRLETHRTAPPAPADGGPTWRLDPAMAGGGILVDHGWHAFYLALDILGDEPETVSAETAQRKFTASAVEDTATCTLTFPEATAEIFLTWAADARQNYGRLVGRDGRIEIADRLLTVAVGDRTPVETAFAQPLSAGSYHPDWFGAMLDDFREEIYDAALRGTNLREAERCARLLELCYRSAARNGARLPFREPPPPPEAPPTSTDGV